MRKLVPVLAVMALLFAVSAWAADNTMSGWIVDSKCGAKAAHADNEACTKKCLEAGAKPVFVTDDKKEVLAIHNPDAVKGHEGHHVNITGSVNDGAIHVENVEMASTDQAAPKQEEHQHQHQH